MSLADNPNHSLPPEYAEKLKEDTDTVVGLYNQLNQMPLNRFTEKFEDSLDTLKTHASEHTDADLLFVVLGIEIANEEDLEQGDLYGNASTKFIFEHGDEEFIDDMHYQADTIDDADYFFLITLQPTDCPPGTNQPVTELPIDQYHEIISALLYQRIDLFQNNLDQYKHSILTPLVAALEHHPDTTTNDN